jgi:hypothetical protein
MASGFGSWAQSTSPLLYVPFVPPQGTDKPCLPNAHILSYQESPLSGMVPSFPTQTQTETPFLSSQEGQGLSGHS